VLAIVLLTLSIAALIIVFAVEHSWFSDNFNQTINNYGLWRLCFYLNQTCDSWFSTNGPNSNYIEQRLNQNRGEKTKRKSLKFFSLIHIFIVGINAWQALEIVFLFLTTSTLVIALASIICYRLRKNIHYYLAILAAFSVWPAGNDETILPAKERFRIYLTTDTNKGHCPAGEFTGVLCCFVGIRVTESLTRSQDRISL